MRLSSIRNLIFLSALAALIIHTMRLPDYPRTVAKASQGTTPAAPSTPQPTLVVARPIGPDFVMPVQAMKTTRRIEHCFTTEPAYATPVIWKENAVVVAALKSDWETVRKLIEAGAPVESEEQRRGQLRHGVTPAGPYL